MASSQDERPTVDEDAALVSLESEFEKRGITLERRLLELKVGVTHMTPEAARAHVDIARATYVEPVRVVMVYLTAIVAALLAFMVIVLIATKLLQLDTALSIAVVIAAGATVAAPLGILLSKVANKMLPGIPEAQQSKGEAD